MAHPRPDSRRGILYPERLPTFTRLPPTDVADLVAWWWVSVWDLPAGEVSRQELLPFPALNLAVEDGMVGLSGPSTGRSHRDLVGRGWVVGALLRPAAVAALTDDPASLRNRYVELGEPDLHARVAALMPADPSSAAAVAGAWLRARVGHPDADGLRANEMVDVLALPDVVTLSQAADRLGCSQRTLHRLARRHVGLSPGTMLRRRRLQEAAELVRHEPSRDLAAIAADLGYVDQAHLTREFRRVLGFTPGSYRRS